MNNTGKTVIANKYTCKTEKNNKNEIEMENVSVTSNSENDKIPTKGKGNNSMVNECDDFKSVQIADKPKVTPTNIPSKIPKKHQQNKYETGSKMENTLIDNNLYSILQETDDNDSEFITDCVKISTDDDGIKNFDIRKTEKDTKFLNRMSKHMFLKQ